MNRTSARGKRRSSRTDRLLRSTDATNVNVCEQSFLECVRGMVEDNSSKLIAIFIVSLVALGAYQWLIRGPSQGGASYSTEFAAVLDDIDRLAAHPADPSFISASLASGIPGQTDKEIAQLDEDDVAWLLSEPIVEVACVADDPRYLFALGRVALIFGEDDLAFDLLSSAAELGSGPAYYYVSDFFAEDLSTAMEYAETSVNLGFGPARELVRMLKNDLDSGAPGRVVEFSTAGFSFDRFHQPNLLRALHSGEDLLNATPVVPSSAPDFIRNAEGNQLVSRMVTTMYACHLAVALGEKAKEEHPAYLAPETPRLARIVHADTANAARLRLTTKEMLLVNKGVGIVKHLAMLSPIVEETKKIAEYEKITYDSLVETGRSVVGAALDTHKRLKATDLFNDAVRDQAALDATRLQDAYYEGASEVEAIYQGLRRFIHHQPSDR